MKIDAEHFQTFTEDTSSETQLRLVLDTIDNAFALAYDGHPDRVIVVDGGTVAFVGRTVVQQLEEPSVLMTDEAREWLQDRFSRA